MSSFNRSCALSGFIRLVVVSLCVFCLIWAIWFYGVYIGYANYKTRGHQEFARNGLAQIAPAAQMDHLFDDCRHYITYEGRNTTSTWNAVAFFGGRYELTMQVPVEIESSRRGRMSGSPTFYLNEVEEVSITRSGQVGASFSNNLVFGPAEWKTVFEADGDFGAVGFRMTTGPPIKGFKEYARASR